MQVTLWFSFLEEASLLLGFTQPVAYTLCIFTTGVGSHLWDSLLLSGKATPETPS